MGLSEWQHRVCASVAGAQRGCRIADQARGWTRQNEDIGKHEDEDDNEEEEGDGNDVVESIFSSTLNDN